MPIAHLQNRSFIRVSGTGAFEFLQNLITTDLDNLPENVARTCALLTPQGKILFDFLIWKNNGEFTLETDTEQADTLLRRLLMYKLRAPVDLTRLEATGINVIWDEEAPETAILDGRFDRAGIKLYRVIGDVNASANVADYDSLRIQNGIVEASLDYQLQDAFPHDTLMDVNEGVSFRKGCFVGQEVVSRMKHRGTARRRVVIITAKDPLPATGTEITANNKPIGNLGTVNGENGLAIIRIDRAAEALSEGSQILAGNVNISVKLPEWSGLTFPQPQADTTPEA